MKRLLMILATSFALLPACADDGPSDGDEGDGSEGDTTTGDGDTTTGDGDTTTGDGDTTTGDGDTTTGDGDTTTDDTTDDGDTTDDTTTDDTTTDDTGADNCAEPVADCAALQAAFAAETQVVRSCSSDAQCGQVLQGTSCGCTRDWVARTDADTTCFYSLIEQAGPLQCDLGLASTCDCPGAEGFVCEGGICQWNYL